MTIATVGLERAAVLIKNDISHGAVGDDNTAPTIDDTTLTNEIDREAPDTAIVQGKVIQIRTQHVNANLPATTEELGLFMNGTGAADSGELLIHILSTFVKGTQDLLTIFEIELEDST